MQGSNRSHNHADLRIAVFGLNMAAQTSVPRATRSQSPSAKFYSRTFSTHNTSRDEDHRPNNEVMDASAPQAKRRKLNPASDTETATEVGSSEYRAANARASQHHGNRQLPAARSKRFNDGGVVSIRATRASLGNSYTKRASALNLHNYPTDHHPVGIAIWVIQKIDSARRERSGSSSSRDSSPGSFPAVSSSTGTFQISGHASEFEEDEDSVDRRQAQRERKIKQRLENWAKSR